MLRSSVCGVMICEKAGRVVVSALSMGGKQDRKHKQGFLGAAAHSVRHAFGVGHHH